MNGNGSGSPASTVNASMHEQLCSLYGERDRLLSALGTADADDIIEMVTALRRSAPDASLVAQLESLYEERDVLQQQLGTVDPWTIAGRDAEAQAQLDTALRFAEMLLARQRSGR